MSDTIRHLPLSFIPEAEVSYSRLCAALDAAAMDCERQTDEDDDRIYVRQGVGFPLWVQIDGEFRRIQLHTYVNIDARIEGKFEAVNAINEEAPLLQFHIDGTRLYGYSWMTFAYGMDSRQFILMLRDFSAIFRTGADRLVEKVESEGQYRN